MTAGPGAIRHPVHEVRHGRLQRSLSLPAAAGSAVTAAEVFLEHDRTAFGNRVMWWPVCLGPFGVVAGIAGSTGERAARTALPLASAAITANGLQGTYLRIRGIGGWHMARYNLEFVPPLFAPLLMSMVGGMGLLGSVLRREK